MEKGNKFSLIVSFYPTGIKTFFHSNNNRLCLYKWTVVLSTD